MKALEARALLFQRKLAYEDYKASIPGIPELDGQLGVLELRAIDTTNVDKLAQTESGRDESLTMAGLVCKSLVLRETKERLFNDTDIEGVAGFGLSVLMPLVERINVISGVSADALEAAKKNLKTTTGSDSPSSSHATSEAAHARNS